VKKELADRNRLLQQIVKGTSRTTGEAYFHELVRNLAQTLDVKFAFTSELLGGKESKRVRAFAIWGNNEFLEPFEYDLAGTPCETLLTNAVSYFGDELQKSFPEAKMLSELSVRSYLGVPFFDSQGKPLGHIAIMDTKPLEDEQQLSAVMQIFADRVGAEYERRLAHKESEESQERFRGFFETAADAAVIVDESGAIVQVNTKFEALFGYERDEILGSSIDTFVPEELRGHHVEMRNRYLEQPTAREMKGSSELKAVRKDQSRFFAEISLSPMRTKEGLFITAVVSDVTAHKKVRTGTRAIGIIPDDEPDSGDGSRFTGTDYLREPGFGEIVSRTLQAGF